MNLDDDDDDGGGEGAPAWMATYSDLATLLLTFFVLLLSFAEMDVQSFKEMLGSVKEAFGVQFEHPGSFQALATSPIELSKQESTRIVPLNQAENQAVQEMQRLIQQLDLQDDVEILMSSRGLILRLRDHILFPTGSDQLSEEAAPVLDKIRELALVFPAGLSIEGHTDDRPIHTARFPSNWELSSARATAVLRYFRKDDELDIRRLKVVGFADTQPVDEADSDEARSKNRRVEFVFEREPPEPPTPQSAAEAIELFP
ncbi:MAG TPA: OmpA family protein [Polyangiaceae bacterium LLY-WYZ-14_1]|nr:OmpA family protein [Polyangiaceae bacterium LLY-WYZ-14_1]